MTDVFPDAYVTDTGFNDIVTMMSTFDNASGTVASSDTISATPRPRFPLELWAMTIRNMRDRTSHAELAYLWTTVRRVSKFFEQEIENLFLEMHVGKTWIYADCGRYCNFCRAFRKLGNVFRKKSEGSDDTHGPYWDLAIAGFRFSDLGAEDESRAIFEYCFKGEQDTYSPFFGYTSGDKQHFLLHDLSFRLSSNKDKKNPQLSCWEEDEATTEVRYSGSELPDEKQRIFVVQVRNGLIDAEFSKFQLDTTNDSVCVDWRNLVTNYFDQHSAGVRQKEKDADLPEPSEENAAGLQQMDTLDRNFGWPAMSSKPFETDAWHQHYLEQQFEAYRKSFGDRVKDGDVLSTEKLRKRRVVDVEVFLTVDGSAAPRYSMKRQVSEELKRMFF